MTQSNSITTIAIPLFAIGAVLGGNPTFGLGEYQETPSFVANSLSLGPTEYTTGDPTLVYPGTGSGETTYIFQGQSAGPEDEDGASLFEDNEALEGRFTEAMDMDPLIDEVMSFIRHYGTYDYQASAKDSHR